MWSDDSGGYENVTITLRPLHDRRLSGYLAAEVGLTWSNFAFGTDGTPRYRARLLSFTVSKTTSPT